MIQTTRLLTKPHKPDNPGHIITTYRSPTECVSIHVDSHLQTIVQSLPSYMEDINHFLKILYSFPFDNNGCSCHLPLYQHPSNSWPLCLREVPNPSSSDLSSFHTLFLSLIFCILQLLSLPAHYGHSQRNWDSPFLWEPLLGSLEENFLKSED